MTNGHNVAAGGRWTVNPATVRSLEKAGLIARFGLDGDSGAPRYRLTEAGLVEAEKIGRLSVLAGTREL